MFPTMVVNRTPPGALELSVLANIRTSTTSLDFFTSINRHAPGCLTQRKDLEVDEFSEVQTPPKVAGGSGIASEIATNLAETPFFGQ